ncbi:PAS domain-containing protein [uncultured Ramlibacter sp.]|uniref:PAS domain-containing protein n=1 Tax=uncultured Ramlibacter sp. TaxID=260755 RepID=UPI00261E2113|nr:PAS domain-containing protein [uncultured Ramlibacter sp.]
MTGWRRPCRIIGKQDILIPMAEPLMQEPPEPPDLGALSDRMAALERENQTLRERVAELHLGQSRFHNLVDATGDVIWITECDPERVVYCSASFERIWGHTVEGLYRDPSLWIRSIHVDDRTRIGQAFHHWLAQPTETWEAEFRIVRPDGQVRWIHERGVSAAEDDGKARVIGASKDITEQRATAAALRESEERFALAVEGSADGIWDWDIQTGLMYMSERAQELYGLVPSALTLRPRSEWLGVVHEPQPDVSERRLATTRYLAGETDFLDAEWRFRQADGTDRWRRVRGRGLRDASGKAIRLSGSITDIDARKRAEQALEQSQERFALAVEGSTDGIWDWDIQTGLMYMSERAQELYGLVPSARSLRPRSEWLAAVQHPEPDIHERRLAMERYITGETERLDAEWRFRQLDGTDLWRRIRGRCLRDANGKAIRLSGSISDVDSRKRAEQALEQSEQRYALAVAGSNDGIWDWDIASGMQYYSERAQRIYGLTPGPTKRHRSEWRRLVPIHPDDYHEQINAITDYLAGRISTYGGEWRVLLPGGGYKWIRLRGESVRDAAGLPVRLAGSVSDIDDLKREQASRQQSQRLEAVGTLAGGIAHDFNNILGAILGFGEMSLRRTRQGSRMRRDLECIVMAGERGRTLVDRILAFSRSSVSERMPVHVEKVVRESVDLLKPALHGDVQIECDLRTGTAAIMGDATQVHQVLGNLATNAAQAMPDGGRLGIVLECLLLKDGRSATTGSLEPGEYIVLTVSDTGSGIAPEDRQRIFDPFFTTKEVNVGTGLGLSLVHGIVSELGGAIDLMSSVGDGSSFVVYLPRSGDVAEPREVSQQNLPRGSQQRVLVVDDDPALTRLTSELCADLGYQWMSCTSSIEAARVFRNRPDHFDVVLTDERMPGLSGTALIRSLKEVRGDIPIIMMSGYLGDALVSRAHALGATAVLAKPVSRTDLATVLSDALASTAGRQRGGNGSE